MERLKANFVQKKSSHRPRDGVPPRVVQFGDRRGEFAGSGFDRQFVAADFADLHRRNAHQFRALNHFHRVQRLAGDDDARLRFAEKQGVEAQSRAGVSPAQALRR